MKTFTVQGPSHSIGVAPNFSVLKVLPNFAAWFDRRRQRIHLAELDQHLLDDIGISRNEADRESRRWN